MGDRVEITINGIQCTAPPGATILEVAKENGMEIPNLCYDPELSIAGACRLCVVEVEGARTLQAACATPVFSGMIVYTDSPRVIEARKAILELMLANHPEDCLTCEKAGNCKLQDYAYKYQIKKSSFKGERKEYAVDERSPFIERDHSKCILCGKCVRVCDEIQGIGAIDFVRRGFGTLVTTAYDEPLNTDICRFCGQCVEVCPVGALMNKQFKGRGRRWEVARVTTTCPFCGTGCNFDLNVRDGKVVGVTSNPNSPVNGRWLCVKGRFGSDFIHDRERLTAPLVKKGSVFVAVSWDEALDLVADRLSEIKRRYGKDSVGALSSARCTNEENYLMQKFMRVVVGNNNVDHCART